MKQRPAPTHWPLTCAVLTCIAMALGNFASSEYDVAASAMLLLPLLVAIYKLFRVTTRCP